jgi:7-carboxy-7-deazaguanine synthase
LKFVVGSRLELAEIHVLLEALGTEIPRHRVLPMPEGVDPLGLRAAGREVAEWCKETGFRFCDRLHVQLYGNTRGT